MLLLIDKQLNFKIKIHIYKNSRKVALMIDTEASAHEFVKSNFAKYYKFSTIALFNFVQLKLADNDTAHQLTHMI